MKNSKTLKERIVQSIFIYETRQVTFETIIKTIILLFSGITLLIFGGVIGDILIENEIGGLLKGYSYTSIGDLASVVFEEIPMWLFISYLIGLIVGCILIITIIRNWKLIFHKIKSIFQYWFNI